MIKTVYTIGYSGFKLKDFIDTIHENEINLVVDVRSKPYSQYYSDFNKENMEKVLTNEHVFYRNYATEFGARQTNSLFHKRGYMDFELFSQSDSFLDGFDKIEKNIEKGFTPVLMCAEKDPFNCHRAILVSRAFFLSGYQIKHIMPNRMTITQVELESRLLNFYYPNRDQLSLIDEIKSDHELVIEAYRKRNQEIGFFMGDED